MDELLYRQMPHSLEAEQAVLGSMLIDANCIKDVMEKLRPEDFYLRQNREIFETIYSMFLYSKPIDGVTVAGEMERGGKVHPHIVLVELHHAAAQGLGVFDAGKRLGLAAGRQKAVLVDRLLAERRGGRIVLRSACGPFVLGVARSRGQREEVAVHLEESLLVAPVRHGAVVCAARGHLVREPVGDLAVETGAYTQDAQLAAREAKRLLITGLAAQDGIA